MRRKFLAPLAILSTILAAGDARGESSPPTAPPAASFSRILDAKPIRGMIFSLWTWDSFPSVIVFDFIDRTAQADAFRRIGFFVEVADTSGSILPREAYGDRHVYNAHDYRVEDLSRFFSLARDSSIPLYEAEKALLESLVRIGMLDEESRPVPGGPRALVSISRDFDADTRAHYLRHELLHAIYFADERWEAATAARWEGLAEPLRALWRLFLSNKGFLDGREGFQGYDPANEDLLRNEAQAFSLQQDRARTATYFERYRSLLRKKVPGAPELLIVALELDPEFPMDFVDDLRADFASLFGFGPDELFGRGP